MHPGQSPDDGSMGACILEVQVSLKVGRSSCRRPLIPITGITVAEGVESILVFIGIVIPGEAEGA